MEEYVGSKVAGWVQEVERLSLVALSHPHAAYAAFTHGLSSQWTYVARTIPDIGDPLLPLEEVIRHRFLTSLTGRSAFSDAERDVMALPVRLGGLGITNPTQEAVHHHNTSLKVTASLVALILQQSNVYCTDSKDTLKQAKLDARKTRQQWLTKDAAELMERLPNDMRRTLQASSEKGASNWLSTLPIAEHGFALHKEAFRDALCLRYGWRSACLPTTCVCGKNFSVEYALNCPCGGLPSMRHNELRDITAQCLTQVCHGVGIEPHLQPLSDEPLHHSTANRDDGARLDIVADGFWGGRRQRTFFDMRVFNPFAQSHSKSTLAQCYRKNEQEEGVQRESQRG